jgi:hypothetical protein
MGKCEAGHGHWANAFWADQGLFALQEAHDATTDSRSGISDRRAVRGESHKHRPEGGKGTRASDPVT